MESIFDILLAVAVIGTLILGFILLGMITPGPSLVVGKVIDFSMHNAPTITGVILLLILLVYTMREIKNG